MKKWIRPAAFVMATLWLVSCSPKISKIEYERQTYELEQLQQRLDLLQKNQEKKKIKLIITIKYRIKFQYNLME